MNTIGYFDKLLQPRTRLTVKGNRKAVRIDPGVDTGFNGDLSLPVAVAIPLGLELNGQVDVELADGSTRKELVFKGSVIWRDHEHHIDIFLTELSDALIGSGLLHGQQLTIGYGRRSVAIEPDIVPKSPKAKKRKSAK
jgi:clan AA aspartic protease